MPRFPLPAAHAEGLANRELAQLLQRAGARVPVAPRRHVPRSAAGRARRGAAQRRATALALMPGSAAGVAFDRWARLCFTAVPEAELEAALARLRPLLWP